MIGKTALTDELLVAYADHELDQAAAGDVEAALQGDPAARARLARLRASADLARQAFATPADEAIPQSLLDTVMTAPIGNGGAVDLDAARRRRREANGAGGGVRSWWQSTALAASIALAIGLAGGVMLDFAIDGTEPATALAGKIAADSPLQKALEQSASLVRVELNGGNVQPLQSYRDADGRYCREYRVQVGMSAGGDAAHGVACRDQAGQWRTEVLVSVASSGKTADIYRPAAATTNIIDRALDGLGVDAPLSADEERSLIAGGWKAQ